MKEIGKIIRKPERWNEWVEIKGTVSREEVPFSGPKSNQYLCITIAWVLNVIGFRIPDLISC